MADQLLEVRRGGLGNFKARSRAHLGETCLSHNARILHGSPGMCAFGHAPMYKNSAKARAFANHIGKRIQALAASPQGYAANAHA